MTRRVVVTGIGAISSLGLNTAECWSRLTAGECGIRVHELHSSLAHTGINVAAFAPDISCHFSSSDRRTMSFASQLALLAARQAMYSCQPTTRSHDRHNYTGVYMGSSQADMADICEQYDSMLSSSEFLEVRAVSSAGLSRRKGAREARVSPRFVSRMLPNMPAHVVAREFGCRGPLLCVSTACAAGTHAIGEGFRLIKSGGAQAVICGASEPRIAPLCVSGFAQMRALSACASRPFDAARDGFVIGEGGAVLLLEELSHARERLHHVASNQAKSFSSSNHDCRVGTDNNSCHGEIGGRYSNEIFAEILGYANTSDAYHCTSPRTDAVEQTRAMQMALREADLEACDVTYVNAHAAGTKLGDRIELMAIHNATLTRTNTGPPTYVSSCKGSVGHLLGAAGSFETAMTVLACRHGLLPPNVALNSCDDLDAIDGGRVRLVGKVAVPWEVQSGRRRIALKNSFGFGGTNASLCISEFVS